MCRSASRLALGALVLLHSAALLRAEDPRAPSGDSAPAATPYADAFSRFPAWPDDAAEARALQIARTGWTRGLGSLEEFIAQTQPAIEAVILGSKGPAAAFTGTGRRPAQPVPRAADPAIRRITALLLMHVHHHAFTIRHAEAGRTAAATLSFAADAARGGGLPEKVAEAEVRLSVLRALELTLRCAPSDDPFWKEFPAAWRRALERSPSFADALDVEARVDPSTRREEVRNRPEAAGSDRFAGQVYDCLGALDDAERRAIVEDVSRRVGDLVLAAREALSRSDPMVLNTAASAVARPGTVEPGTLAQALTCFQFSELGRQYRTVLTAEARSQALRVQIALKRFRLDRQEWPATLADLQPVYLKTIPVDPFDGKPLRYFLKPDGPLLYSAGPNGVDDDGARPFVEGDELRGTDLIISVFE
ncbi:MAG: hypothetical protein HYY93_13635 [Planctomycetes bacterium]|nr:hypothetical protein [Planctomycetota bacterium]